MAEAAEQKLPMINMQCDPDIRAATDEYIEAFNKKNDSKVSIRSTTESALKMYLRKKGYWPRKKPAKAGGA